MSETRRLSDLDGIMTVRRPSKDIEISTRAEVNRVLAVRWFQQVWNERRTETIDELFGDNAVGHTEGGDQDRAGFKAAREGLLDAFPDFSVKIEDTVADGDHVVVRWRVTGTHQGAGLGLPPTNRAVDFRGMTWMTFKDGLIVEGWDSWNLGALLESLR
jgi:steroid delta-isomerase-like uncharacterized protein